MDSNSQALLVAVLVAVASVVVLRYVERIVAIRLGPPSAAAIPTNVEALIVRVTTDMAERHKAEIAGLRNYYEDQLSDNERKIADLERRVDWLFGQLVAAGGKPPPAEIAARSYANGTAEILAPVVLGIWPPSDLSIRAEIDAIFRSGIKYEVLDSNVTRGRLLAEVDRMKPAILHVGAHASAEGVVLEDGLALLGWWRNLANLYAFSLVILNACTSLEIVDGMHDNGVAAVVGIRKEMADAVAVTFTREFYGWLLRGRSVQAAVTLTKLSLSHTDAELIVARGDWSLS